MLWTPQNNNVTGREFLMTSIFGGFFPEVKKKTSSPKMSQTCQGSKVPGEPRKSGGASWTQDQIVPPGFQVIPPIAMLVAYADY